MVVMGLSLLLSTKGDRASVYDDCSQLIGGVSYLGLLGVIGFWPLPRHWRERDQLWGRQRGRERRARGAWPCPRSLPSAMKFTREGEDEKYWGAFPFQLAVAHSRWGGWFGFLQEQRGKARSQGWREVRDDIFFPSPFLSFPVTHVNSIG